MISKLVFRCCEACDGRKFALLTDQPEVEECFDSGYKIAYKERDDKHNSELLAQWRTAYTVATDEFEQLTVDGNVPGELLTEFNKLVGALICGIDVLFCDYNLGITGDLPMCNDIIDTYRSTDFVLFSCDAIVGDDPKVQPYAVSYMPHRYDEGKQIARQHRIYCKTEPFAFCQAINAIVLQRSKDNILGGHIRPELGEYIAKPMITETDAKASLNHFVDAINSWRSKQGKMLPSA